MIEDPITKDFIRQLLEKDVTHNLIQPKRRMGKKGIIEIKEHMFFEGIDWDALAKREIVSPLLEHLCENRPEHFLCNEIKIDQPTSLDGLADGHPWNHEYSLRPNSTYIPRESHESPLNSQNDIEIIHQYPTNK